MAFRDDREVLKQRAQELEQSLAEANKKLDAQEDEAARAKQLEAELAAARATLERIEAQLPKKPDRSQPLMLGALALVGAAIVGGGAWLLGRPARAPMPPTADAAATSAEDMPADLRDLLQRTPGRSAAPAPPPEPAKEVTARWLGKAKTVAGLAIKPGAGCSVDAVLRSSRAHDVTISCGGEVLYRSTDELNGMSQMKTGASESPSEQAGKSRAVLVWNDVGARTGARSQASIDSQARVASAWSDTAPSYRVDIEISMSSEPYEGAFEKGHTPEALPFPARIERSAKVTKITGKAPIQKGALCRARVSPTWEERHNCRVLLWCNGLELYGTGTTGYSHCETADAKPTLFRDDSFEGDPKLTWDFAKGTITLGVQADDAEWSADFAVSEK